MPVWLTLFAGILATGGFFLAIFGLIFFVVQGKKTKGQPRFDFGPGKEKGTLDFWVVWDATTFDVEFYRLRIQQVSPDAVLKESTYTYTFDPALKGSFSATVRLPEVFQEIIDSGTKRSLITLDVRSTEEYMLHKSLTGKALKKRLQGGKSAPSSAKPATEAVVEVDPPAVMTLDYSELVVRRKKLRDLEAAAAAKAAKKAAAAPPKAPAAADKKPAEDKPTKEEAETTA